MDSLRIVQTFTISVVLAVVVYAGVKYSGLLGSGDTDTTASVAPKNITASPREILSYIPADTLFYMGGSEPMSSQDAFGFFPPKEVMAQQAEALKTLEAKNVSEEPEGAKMIIGLAAESLSVMKDPKTAFKQMGVGDALDMVIYSVGALPVMRFKLADKDAFTAFIDRSENIAGAKPVIETQGDTTYRSYAFEQDEDLKTKLIIAIQDSYAVISIFTSIESEQVRKTIIGLQKPTTSLASTSIINDLKKQYQFHPVMFGYLNHIEIIKGVTHGDTNDFGRMLDASVEMIDKNSPPSQQHDPDDPFAAWRTPECQAEVMAAAQLWPRTVFGYTELNSTSSPKRMKSKLVIESKDTVLMKSLRALRGFIPASANQKEQRSLLSLGFGINVDAIVPTVNSIVSSITQKDYQCALFADFKQQLITANPAMIVGMGAAMAGGVQGVSAAIIDITGTLDLSTGQPIPKIDTIDALVTISTNNPQNLVMMAANFPQGQGQAPLTIPADGTPVDFPIPLPLPPGKKVKLAIKGQHIVAYIGVKAEKAANALATVPLKANGLVAIGMDFQKYISLMLNSMKSQPQDDALTKQNQQMMDSMKDLNMSFVERFDFADDGIVINVDMLMN